MKKRNFIGEILAVACCAAVLCAFAANENTDVPETTVSNQQTPATVFRTGGKVLVAYFSVPETDAWMLLREQAGWLRMANCKAIPGTCLHHQRSHRR